ncbi:GAF and ANTAR domain-containing protein [Actinomycetospora sp. TBRC 11914]|uniref:GAF and ANTAR domain-containing protein n=1 Tax=Actinomycetospora sp. TBRC 11914 TaxID=2729387 RepID=UPI00145E89EA|nr:GAF and ANTAR domain-containing protein [Actinomycetospora sp. TBRC 11914]NMO88504.1 ANTAR domain-containing protein [Actinomycetospora sp. TBRC 11914]
MATEEEWQAARSRFVEHEAGGGDDARGAGSVSVHVTPDLGPLAAEFVGLSRDLFTVPPETGVVGVLERVVRRAAAIVPAAMVSVTLRESDGTFHTPTETDPLATRADGIQYETGEGPCVEATATSSTGFTASTDLAHDERYPHFGPRVVDLGFTALCSTGMFPGGDPPRLGALNYYFRGPAGLSDVDEDAMLILASHAAVALHAARNLEAEKLRTAQLTEALQSRDVIGQAKGILMERRGASADEAFDVLRRASQDLNIKIRDIAETIATRRAEL